MNVQQELFPAVQSVQLSNIRQFCLAIFYCLFINTNFEKNFNKKFQKKRFQTKFLSRKSNLIENSVVLKILCCFLKLTTLMIIIWRFRIRRAILRWKCSLAPPLIRRRRRIKHVVVVCARSRMIVREYVAQEQFLHHKRFHWWKNLWKKYIFYTVIYIRLIVITNFTHI